MTPANASELENGRRLCWERVEQTAPLFRVSRIFVPAGSSDALLALYALFASLEQLGWLADEPVLMATNIQWWGNELLGSDNYRSRHPVLQLLMHSGALDRLPENLLAGLITRAADPLESEPPSGMDELRETCLRQQQIRSACELELQDTTPTPTITPDRAEAVGGLLQLIRALLLRPASGSWWVPMDILARLQKERAEVSTDQEVRHRVLSDIVNAAGNWRGGILAQDPDTGEDAHSGLSLVGRHVDEIKWKNRHFLIYQLLLDRQFSRLGGAASRNYLSALDRLHPGDFFAAWRLARRLNPGSR